MNVDKRVVEMQFNNAQFERGVKDTLGSLDNLKKGLDLSESAKNLANLQKQGDKFTLANMVEGVQGLVDRFSTLGVIGMSVLHNLTTKIMDLGIAITKALTLDPVLDGFGEYEQKIDAIQIILSNTKSKGTTLDQVSTTLDELNEYADLTVYNFADMTSAIGKFTAAGNGLEDSVAAIKGISNIGADLGAAPRAVTNVMTQFSQSLSSGKLMLQDWNSAMYAGMAGEKMWKGLTQAVYDLGEVSESSYKKVMDGSISFREAIKANAKGEATLSVSSKAMMLAFKRFADDPSMLESATKIKTFTQLIGTMKESLGSGWAQSWGYIIGDLDQSATIFTNVSKAFDSIIGPSTDARNAMLKFWNENGGRDAIITGLSEAFRSLKEILTPIGDAWNEVFPAMTGEKLVEFSKKFKDFFEGIKIGEKTIANIKKTFSGLFSIISIGKNIIGSLLSAVGQVLKALIPAGDGVLGFTGSIGDMLTELNKAVETTGVFKAIFGGLAAAISKALKGISTAINWISDSLTKMTDNADFSWFGLIAKAVTAVGKAFRKMGELIGNALKGLDFNSGIAFVNGGILAAILLGVKKFIGNMTEMVSSGGGFLSGLKDLLDGVKGSLEAWQQNLKANVLLKIAGAIALLTASLFLLSTIDPVEMGTALGAITTLFTELFGSMAVLSKIMGSEGFRSVSKITTAMIGLSAAILILSFAMKNIASLSWEEIAKGLVAIGGLMLALVGVSYLLDRSHSQLVKGSVGLILFSTSMVILAQALKSMGTMSWEEIAKGLGTLMGSLATIAVVMKAMPKNMIGQAVALIAISTAMLILSQAISGMASMSWEEIAKGLGTLMGSLATIAVTMKAMPKNMLAQAIALIGISTAIVILSNALVIMGNMSWESIAKGLGTLTGALSILAVTMNAMPKNMIVNAVALIGISSALIILSKALGTMGKMSWDEIAKGLGTLMGSLAILAVMMKAMTSALPGAAALLVISAALLLLTPVLVTMSKLSWEEIVKGLAMLAGVFAIFGVAALVLTPVIPTMYALAGAIALLGVGVLAAGLGLLALGAGLTALAASVAASGGAIYSIIESLLSLIPLFFKKIGEGIVAFCGAIAEGAPAIKDAFVALVGALVDAIVESVPKIVKGIFVLLDAILENLVIYVPKFVDYLFKMLIEVINVLAERMPELIAAGAKLLMAFVTGVLNELNKLSGTDIQGLIVAISALIVVFTLISTLAAVMAVAGIAILGLAGVLAILGGIAQIPGLMWLVDEGSKFMGAIGKAIGSFVGGLVGGFASVASDALPKIGANLAEFMNAVKPFFEGVKTVDESASRGVLALAQAVLALTAANILEGLTSWLTGGSSIVDFGKELAEFGPYFKQYADSVVGIDGTVVSNSANAALTLAEFAGKLPKSGGVSGWITGESSLSTFAQELKEFGPILMDYASSVTGLDGSVVVNSANAALALAELANNLPNQGGMASWFAGDNTLSTFAEELVVFGPKLKAYADSVTGLDGAVVVNSANAALSLAELANNLPNQGGMVSWFAGDNTLSTFGEELSKFGPYLKSYADSVAGLDANVVTNSTNAASALSQLAANLPNSGGLVSWFAGDNNIGTFGENIARFGEMFKAYYDHISAIDVSVLDGVVKNVWDLVGIANGVQGVKMDGMKTFGKSMTELGKIGIDGIITAFDTAIDKIKALGIKVVTNIEDGVRSKIPAFKTAGSDASQGFIDGLDSKLSASTEAGRRLGTAALIAAKEAIDSNSPSKEFMYLGEFAGDGLVIGLDNSIGPATNAASTLMTEILNQSKNTIKDFEAWVSDRKYYNELSLIEELAAWEAVQARYKEGTEERKKADREVFRVQNGLVDATYQHSIDWIEEEKYYNRLSREEELAAWERIQSRYMWGSEERKKADREVYRLRNELVDESYQKSLAWIAAEKAAGRLSLEDEIAAYDRIKARYTEGDEEYTTSVIAQSQARTDAKKAEYDASMAWIEEEKHYKRLSLVDELAAYTRVQQRYEKGTEERMKADREIFRLQQEINDARTQYYDDIEKVQEDSNNRRLQLEQEYRDKSKEIQDQLAVDIKDLDDAYASSLDSRTKSLYSSYGLFDEVGKKKSVKGSTLMKNLQDQVNEFGDWRSQLSQLSGKGINSALLDELEQMGPDAIAEIKALNSMSSSELAQYTNLWGQKHEQAKAQATSELEGLKLETQAKIAELRVQSAAELDLYRSMWNEKMDELATNTATQLNDLTTNFEKEVGIMKTNTEEDFNTMVTNVQEIVKEAGWNELGQGIVDGMSEGVESGRVSFVNKIIEVISAGIEAAKNAADIHSPSRVFAKIGRFMDEGLIIGLESYKGKVAQASEGVGKEAISSISMAIGGITDLLSSDMNAAPTIRPVLDLTNIHQGLNHIDKTLTSDRSMTLGMTANSNNQNGSRLQMEEFTAKLTDANIKSNNKIVSAIDGLKADFADLVDKVTGLQVVMDTGSLVGAITPEMDRSLGTVVTYNRRGIK